MDRPRVSWRTRHASFLGGQKRPPACMQRLSGAPTTPFYPLMIIPPPVHRIDLCPEGRYPLKSVVSVCAGAPTSACSSSLSVLRRAAPSPSCACAASISFCLNTHHHHRCRRHCRLEGREGERQGPTHKHTPPRPTPPPTARGIARVNRIPVPGSAQAAGRTIK